MGLPPPRARIGASKGSGSTQQSQFRRVDPDASHRYYEAEPIALSRSTVRSCDRTTSATTWRDNRQCCVSVAAKSSSSANLLAGAPPRHRRKYAHLARQAETPSAISAAARRNRSEATTDTRESVFTLPNVKSPTRGCDTPASSGEKVESRPSCNTVTMRNGSFSSLPVAYR